MLAGRTSPRSRVAKPCELLPLPPSVYSESTSPFQWGRSRSLASLAPSGSTHPPVRCYHPPPSRSLRSPAPSARVPARTASVCCCLLAPSRPRAVSESPRRRRGQKFELFCICIVILHLYSYSACRVPRRPRLAARLHSTSMSHCLHDVQCLRASLLIDTRYPGTRYSTL